MARSSSQSATSLSQMHERITQVLGAPDVVETEAFRDTIVEPEASGAIGGGEDGGLVMGVGAASGMGVEELAPPGRVLSGNFGGLPSTDRQIVVDGCNVAW